MDVPSLLFLGLAVAAACLFNLSGSRLWRAGVLLAVNVAFLWQLGAASVGKSFVHLPLELLPYAAFLAMGFGLVHAIRKGVAPAAYIGAIVLVLLVFFWLKKYTFLPEATFISSPYLVIGLSYVFFRVLHLVIDARDPDAFDRIGLAEYLNYTLNFTSLVSGPIQRYEDYHAMTTAKPPPLGPADLGVAAERIVTGMFKVMVMAVAVSAMQKELHHQLLSDSLFAARAWHGALLMALYPVFLFFNFSGYTDFVIGVARLFRIRLPENFDKPFSAVSFIEYWNRWHMSLSNWLKTYVYNPLVTVLLRRVTNAAFLPYASAAALFVTFFLIGAWHGRTSKFMFFGVLNGLGVAVNQAYRIAAAKRMGRKGFNALAAAPWYSFVGRGLTFTWVAFTLLWFWSDWPELGRFAAILGPSGVACALMMSIAGGCAALAALQWAGKAAMAPTLGGRPVILSRYTRTVWLTLMVLAIFAVQSVMNAAAPDIVYKDF